MERAQSNGHQIDSSVGSQFDVAHLHKHSTWDGNTMCQWLGESVRIGMKFKFILSSGMYFVQCVSDFTTEKREYQRFWH
jgi:hypothetical protein